MYELEHTHFTYTKLQDKILNTPEDVKDRLINYISNPEIKYPPDEEVKSLVRLKDTYTGWYRFVKDFQGVFENEWEDEVVVKEYKVGDYIDTLKPDVHFNEDTYNEYWHSITIPEDCVEKIDYDPSGCVVYDGTIDEYRYVEGTEEVMPKTLYLPEYPVVWGIS